LGHETFAFDPAGNIQAADTAQQESVNLRAPLPRLLDNLLKEYAGVSYRYDERGNVVERTQDGKRAEYEWDAFNRMTRATTSHGVTTFAYDPLGRRIAKHSQATRTMYSWDGDTLALESSMHRGHAVGERTVHYVYERDSFVPLVQATQSRALRLAPTTDVKALMAGNDGKYDIALDSLWNGEYEREAEPFCKDEIAFYQCDHLGTPQELTDCEGKVAWSAQYKAWGQTKEAISEAAYKAGIRSPIRFQGQYFDDETGLHYNRHRYYDPDTARYLTQDPIRFFGGHNFYKYGPNPTMWVDPLGLSPTWNCKTNRWHESENGRFIKRPTHLMKTEPNTAFFWSGRTEGVGGMDTAANIAKTHGGTTLEMLIDKHKIQMPEWDDKNPVVVKEWGEMSRAYAQGTCGLVRGVVGQDLRPNNIWEGYEKSALMKNPAVNQIDIVDPKYGNSKTIFKR
jgi:RHS repeat-associated protein